MEKVYCSKPPEGWTAPPRPLVQRKAPGSGGVRTRGDSASVWPTRAAGTIGVAKRSSNAAVGVSRDVSAFSPVAPPMPIFPAASNGYYVMLTPLAPGSHQIEFGGWLPDMAQAVTYTLTVR